MAIALPRWAVASWKAERRKAWSPALPHHFTEVVEAGLGEMMGDDFRLGRGALGLVAQDFRRAPVQRLTPAFQQALVGGVLDQRVLEAIGRLMAGAFDEKKVGVGEAFQPGSESSVVDPCHGSQQRMREAASEDRADLGDLARFAERSSRAARDCWSVGGIVCAPPCSPRSRSRRVTSSTNSGTPPVRSPTLSITSFDSA
jgi:hypothetical protein